MNVRNQAVGVFTLQKWVENIRQGKKGILQCDINKRDLGHSVRKLNNIHSLRKIESLMKNC